MDCGLPGSSVHEISQARILEWVAISFSRGSSQSRDQTCVFCIGRRILYHWATGKPIYVYVYIHIFLFRFFCYYKIYKILQDIEYIEYSSLCYKFLLFLYFIYNNVYLSIPLLLFSCVVVSRSVVSNSLQPQGLQHARLPCSSPTRGITQTHVLWVSDAIPPSHPLSSPSPAFSVSQHQGIF